MQDTRSQVLWSLEDDDHEFERLSFSNKIIFLDVDVNFPRENSVSIGGLVLWLNDF